MTIMLTIWAVAASVLGALIKRQCDWLRKAEPVEADPFVFWERQFWAESEQADGADRD